MKQQQKASQASQQSLRVGFHAGAIVMMLAQTYDSVIAVINEGVQNFLDAGAKDGLIVLDLIKKRLHIFDNGRGTSLEAMRNQIARIGQRFKGPTDAGEKNIGKLAGIAIARKCCFISHTRDAKPAEPYFKIFLDRDLVQGEEVDFRAETLPHFSFQDQPWAVSCVAVTDIEQSAITAFKKKSSDFINVICDSIADVFSQKMKEVGTRIKVKVISEQGVKEGTALPQTFPGRREKIEINTPAGPVAFEVYLSRTKHKSPKVLVDHQGRIQFPLKGLPLWQDVSDVFGSGHIQGNIMVSFCQINADKKGFAHSPELQYFNDAVLRFATDYARPWEAELEEQKDLEQFEEIARELLSSALPVLKEYPGLLTEVFGAPVSTGHFGTEGAKPDGTVRTREKTTRKHPKESEVPELPKPTPAPTKEKKQIHTGVSSSSGSKRKAVANQAGLVLIAGEGTGWRVKIGKEGEEKGMIVVNLAHPDYRESQNAGRLSLTSYLRLLVMSILTSALIADKSRAITWRDDFEGVFLPLRKILVPCKDKADKDKK